MRARLLVNAVIVASAAVALALLALSPEGLFSGDEGIKLAETQGLAFSSYRHATVYDPGAPFTPDGSFQPFGHEPFVFTGDDPARAYGTYPLLYPALAAPLYRIGGHRAMALLSFAGFVAVLILTARLARRCLLSEPAVASAVAVVGLATSLPLYATTIYEHTAGAAMLLAAIDVLLGGPATTRRMWVGGTMFGVATCFRTELYAFAPAIAIVIAWRLGLGRRSWLRWLAFAGGSLAVIGAFLVAHRLATPAWHPTLTASADGEVPALDRRLGHIMAFELVDTGWILVVSTVVVAVSRPWLRPRLITAAIAIAWSVAAIFAIRDIGHDDVRTVTGLLTASPVLALGLVRGAGPRGPASGAGVLAAAAACFCATLVLLPKSSALGGLELGARYLLPVMPLLAIAAAEAARRRLLDRVCFVVAFAISVWATAANARAEWRIRELGAHVLTAIDRSDATAMFTPLWWVAQLAVPAQADGVRLFVGERPTAIYDQLYDSGVRRVVALRGNAPPAIGRVRLRAHGETILDDRRLSPHVYELFRLPDR